MPIADDCSLSHAGISKLLQAFAAERVLNMS